mgnify:CR=1 FL=1
MRVFIACLGTETNTFSNLPTGWKTFEETMLFYGDATDNEPNTFSLPLHIWRKRSEERNYEVIESVAAFAQPGGKTLFMRNFATVYYLIFSPREKWILFYCLCMER